MGPTQSSLVIVDRILNSLYVQLTCSDIEKCHGFLSTTGIASRWIFLQGGIHNLELQ